MPNMEVLLLIAPLIRYISVFFNDYYYDMTDSYERVLMGPNGCQLSVKFEAICQ